MVFSSVMANPMQAIMGANLRENASFTIFGNADLNTPNNDEQALVPTKRNEIGFETNISLYKTDNSKIFFMGNANQVDLGENFLIGAQQTPVKSKLLDTSAGFGYSHKNENKTRYSFSSSFGSSSDKFLKSTRDSTIEALASYAMVPTEKGQFILLVQYSNNRSFLNNIPIPLLVYVHRYSERFILTAGLPFLAITLFERQNYAFNATLSPGGYSIEGAKHVSENWQILSGLRSKSKAYKHAERLEDKNRLILKEKELSVGLKTSLSRGFNVTLTTGFSFDRFIHEGKSSSKINGYKIRQQNDTFLQSKIALSF